MKERRRDIEGCKYGHAEGDLWRPGDVVGIEVAVILIMYYVRTQNNIDDLRGLLGNWNSGAAPTAILAQSQMLDFTSGRRIAL